MIDWEKLTAKFPEKDLEWRVGSSWVRDGKVGARIFAYITARAIQDRLDEVCKQNNWRVSYNEINGGFLCTISIYDGTSWCPKSDGANVTDIETVKGGISSAFKRAASAWGIGRYLYALGEEFADVSMTKQRGEDWNYAKDKKSGKEYWWRRKVDGATPPQQTNEKPEEKPPASKPFNALDEIPKMTLAATDRLLKAHTYLTNQEDTAVLSVLEQHTFDLLCVRVEEIKLVSDSPKIGLLRELIGKLTPVLGDSLESLTRAFERRIANLKDESQQFHETTETTATT